MSAEVTPATLVIVSELSRERGFTDALVVKADVVTWVNVLGALALSLRVARADAPPRRVIAHFARELSVYLLRHGFLTERELPLVWDKLPLENPHGDDSTTPSR